MTTARFRRSYADDPTLADGVFELLETCFTGIGVKRRVAAVLGSTWETCSIPFVDADQDRVLSHVGLLEMPFFIKGERTKLGGIHAASNSSLGPKASRR